MILLPLITPWIWLQVFTSAPIPKRTPPVIPDGQPKAEQDHPDHGNPIQ
jgi:hypothetical protein